MENKNNWLELTQEQQEESLSKTLPCEWLKTARCKSVFLWN